MNLFATITSERASKSQGGKELHIVIQNKEKKAAVALWVDTDVTGRVRVGVYHDIRYSHEPKVSAPMFLEQSEKGERQKGEKPSTCHTPEDWETCPRCRQIEGLD